MITEFVQGGLGQGTEFQFAVIQECLATWASPTAAGDGEVQFQEVFQVETLESENSVSLAFESDIRECSGPSTYLPVLARFPSHWSCDYLLVDRVNEGEDKHADISFIGSLFGPSHDLLQRATLKLVGRFRFAFWLSSKQLSK